MNGKRSKVGGEGGGGCNALVNSILSPADRIVFCLLSLLCRVGLRWEEYGSVCVEDREVDVVVVAFGVVAVSVRLDDLWLYMRQTD